MEEQRIKALAQHLDCEEEDLTVSSYNDCLFGYGKNEEYLVVTDSEADDLWDEYLNDYIDDCLEIPKSIRFYFDEEKWKQDAKMDGRGHSLNRYDGSEDTEEVDDETFYIYRQN